MTGTLAAAAGVRCDVVARHLETLTILGELATGGDGRYGAPEGAY